MGYRNVFMGIKPMSTIRKKTIEGLSTGDHFFIKRTFTEQDMIRFGNITKDYNPVHYDDRFAKLKNFKKRICHGLLIGSMVTEIGGQIGWLGSDLSFSFKKPVYFGDTITCCFTIAGIKGGVKALAEVICRNQHGVVVLVATLKGFLPDHEEVEVLEDILNSNDCRDK